MFVFGNGESRSRVNIEKIDDIKVGCNAIMRDFRMNHLVCVDRRMVLEAVENKVNEHSLVYTRSEWHKHFKDYKRLRVVPDLPYVGNQRWDDPFHWGSGPYAVLLAAKLCKTQHVKLLGFDLYSKNDKVNNIYKDSNNYDSSDKRPVDPRYWIHQISKTFEIYSNTKFTIFTEDNWQLPKSWKKSNVAVDNISNI